MDDRADGTFNRTAALSMDGDTVGHALCLRSPLLAQRSADRCV